MPAPKAKAATVDLLKLMSEVDGPIDRAIEQAAREAALEDIRAGRDVPVWEDGNVVWKPAAQALAEADAKRKRSRV